MKFLIVSFPVNAFATFDDVFDKTEEVVKVAESCGAKSVGSGLGFGKRDVEFHCLESDLDKVKEGVTKITPIGTEFYVMDKVE